MQNIKLVFTSLLIIGVSVAMSYFTQPNQTETIKENLSGAFQIIDKNFVDMGQIVSSLDNTVQDIEEDRIKDTDETKASIKKIDDRLKKLGNKVYIENGDIYSRLSQIEKENKELKQKLSNF